MNFARALDRALTFLNARMDEVTLNIVHVELNEKFFEKGEKRGRVVV